MERITLRLPDEVHGTLTAIAKDEERSLNAQIVYALKYYLDSRHSVESKKRRAPTGEDDYTEAP